MNRLSTIIDHPWYEVHTVDPVAEHCERLGELSSETK